MTLMRQVRFTASIRCGSRQIAQHIHDLESKRMQSRPFPWVEVTIGAGPNGKPQKPDFNDQSAGEGSTAMGFYNVLQGDAPYLKFLADHYSMSDNYRQPVMGGTGANSLMWGYSRVANPSRRTI